MQSSITSINEHQLNQVVIRDLSSGTEVIILPDYGAMLHAFSVVTKNGAHNIIDNYPDQDAIQNYLSRSFKSSKLSPFVCRIAEGKYLYEGQEFELATKFPDGSAIHGLLYNKKFKKTDSFADEYKASVAFKYNYKEEDPGYPFHYSCEIRYTLLPKNTLQLQTTILNLDAIPIPITDGWHPYFTLGDNPEQWLLYFAADKMLEFDAKLVPTGHLLPYEQFSKPSAISGTELDNCFLLKPDDGRAACTVRNEENGLQLNIFPDAAYPYLQLFTPPTRKSIAIENLSGAPDAFNNKMGLMMLQPGHTETFTVYYQVDGPSD